MNRRALCAPEQWGGMGIKDLALHNTTPLLKWWRQAAHFPNSLLSEVFTKLYWKGRYMHGPPFRKKKGSFFSDSFIK